MAGDGLAGLVLAPDDQRSDIVELHLVRPDALSRLRWRLVLDAVCGTGLLTQSVQTWSPLCVRSRCLHYRMRFCVRSKGLDRTLCTVHGRTAWLRAHANGAGSSEPLERCLHLDRGWIGASQPRAAHTFRGVARLRMGSKVLQDLIGQRGRTPRLRFVGTHAV